MCILGVPMGAISMDRSEATNDNKTKNSAKNYKETVCLQNYDGMFIKK